MLCWVGRNPQINLEIGIFKNIKYHKNYFEVRKNIVNIKCIDTSSSVYIYVYNLNHCTSVTVYRDLKIPNQR